MTPPQINNIFSVECSYPRHQINICICKSFVTLPSPTVLVTEYYITYLIDHNIAPHYISCKPLCEKKSRKKITGIITITLLILFFVYNNQSLKFKMPQV